MYSKSKVVGIIVGLGFCLPSIRWFLSTVESASKWQLVLSTQPAIEQYRTLSILVFAIGLSICVGSLKETAQKHTLVFASFLMVSLLVGRLTSYLMCATTNLLLIETLIEISGLLLLIWALKSENV